MSWTEMFYLYNYFLIVIGIIFLEFTKKSTNTKSINRSRIKKRNGTIKKMRDNYI